MAISYVPGTAGWNDTAGLGSNANLRLRVESSYNAALNRSTLTVSMQAHAPRYGGYFFLMDTALITCNGSTLLSGGGSGGSTMDYCVYFLKDEDRWFDLIDSVTGETAKWTVTVDHAANGQATASFSVRARLWYSRSISMSFSDRTGSLPLDVTRQFALTVNAGTGSTVTVTRNGTALASGAVISYGDVLTVSFAAQTGYTLTAHTLNGLSFSSGSTHTVTGAVTVAATAARQQFTLTVNAAAGSTIMVTRNGTALSRGAAIIYGDVLTVSFAALSGYELTAHTLNGTSFLSGGTHTVRSAVTVASSARRLGLLRLDTGSAVRRCRVLLDTGSAIVPVRIFLDRGDRITEAGT